MSDDVIGAILVMVIMMVFFGLGTTVHRLETSEEWKCTATAVVHGKAECVEYRRAEEEE